VISIDVNDSSIVTGTIANNTINNLPGIGIFSAVDESATSTLTFNANTVTNSGGDGFQLVNFGGVVTSTMNATVTHNVVSGLNFVGGMSVTGFEDVLDLQLIATRSPERPLARHNVAAPHASTTTSRRSAAPSGWRKSRT
jgi:hypothetical protein